MGRIHRATTLGKYDQVAKCLSDGADVNAIGIHDWTPLLIAARDGHSDIVKLLLKTGADPDLAHPNGRAPLHFAAANGHLDIVRALVVRGASLNTLSGIECTPAIEAAMYGHTEVVEYLHSPGADLGVVGLEGLTADDWLREGGVFGRLQKNFPEALLPPGERPVDPESEDAVRRLISECPSADEFAAIHGRNTLVWSFGHYQYNDAEVATWARRVWEVISTPTLLEECEERYLTGDALDDARKTRAVRARSEARRAKRHRHSDGVHE